MDQRHANHAAGPTLGASRQSLTVSNKLPATEDRIQSDLPAMISAYPITVAFDYTKRVGSDAAGLGTARRPAAQRPGLPGGDTLHQGIDKQVIGKLLGMSCSAVTGSLKRCRGKLIEGEHRRGRR
jgi:hypothetical protein